MRLATLDDGSRDGQLVVVDRSGSRYATAESVAPSLQRALDDWGRCAPSLRAIAAELDQHPARGRALDLDSLLAPLPRAYEWIDGSSYLNHILLARRARNADPPPDLESDPLVYQGGSSVLLGARAPIPLPDVSFGLDFEGEIAMVLTDVPRGLRAPDASGVFALCMLANDLSYRNLIPRELAKGFGFFNSKPATAFSPFAVSLDELGPLWRGGRVHATLRCWLNGELVGELATGGEMHFSFCDLVEHIAHTRSFSSGTILGGGTVSNADERAGVACLAERRCRETLAGGAPLTRFLEPGDRVRIELFGADGQTIFGAIDQKVVAA